jgi:hypothetical protein
MGATEFATMMLCVSVVDVPRRARMRSWFCRLFHQRWWRPTFLHRQGPCCVSTKCWLGTGCKRLNSSFKVFQITPPQTDVYG